MKVEVKMERHPCPACGQIMNYCWPMKLEDEQAEAHASEFQKCDNAQCRERYQIRDLVEGTTFFYYREGDELRIIANRPGFRGKKTDVIRWLIGLRK